MTTSARRRVAGPGNGPPAAMLTAPRFWYILSTLIERPDLADSERAAVSHTIAKTLLRRLERISYKHRVSRSAIVEYAVTLLFSNYPTDVALGEFLISSGAARRRTT